MGSIIKKVDKNGKAIFDINFIFRLNYKFLTITFRWGSLLLRRMMENDFGCLILDKIEISEL